MRQILLRIQKEKKTFSLVILRRVPFVVTSNYNVKGLGQRKAISFASNLLYQPDLKRKIKISE